MKSLEEWPVYSIEEVNDILNNTVLDVLNKVIDHLNKHRGHLSLGDDIKTMFGLIDSSEIKTSNIRGVK